MTSLPPDPAPAAAPPREPAINLPGVVLAVIALIVAVHALQWLVGFERDLGIMAEFAVVPARFGLALGLETQEGLTQALRAIANPAEQRQMAALAAYFVDQDGPRWWSLLTYAFLHASVPHVLMNVLWLAVFGAPVARRLGAGVFLALFALGAAAGALLHVWLYPGQPTPLVGASAAVSAMTGAAVRFVFQGGFNPAVMSDDAAVRALPALPFGAVLANRQALMFTGFWFLTNWLFGAGIIPLAGAEQAVAWEAHVGGFIAGLMLFPLLDRRAAA
jgi:membrane associated rhomboid family serine protease